MPIAIRQLSFTYLAGTPFATPALCGVDLTVGDGASLALIGPMGAGKSTLIQHMNGLLVPPPGAVTVDGVDLGRGAADRAWARQRVGLLFQYPEHQLFAPTVYADVAFGPTNLGCPPAEVAERVSWALGAVGVPEALWERSPFSLSGGQKRRVAIAGVLAMRPRYLVLDEPTAGLDSSGRAAFWELLEALHAAGMALVLVTHDMETVARLARSVAVLAGGRVVLEGPPEAIFQQAETLRELGLDVPEIPALLGRLSQRGMPVRTGILDVARAAEEIAACRRRIGPSPDPGAGAGPNGRAARGDRPC